MSDYKPLDSAADVLPVGLQPTPFGEVWQALQQVAASVWNVDPSVYRAGMAWLWYAVNHPDDLASDSLRALLVAALISEQAPLVKDWQTNAELVEYLRVWRTYSPTYAKLEAIFATFGARVEVRPISDAESQGVVPVADRRLAFYLRVEDFDAERPLTLDEVYQIAVRATPLGARPVPYFALVGSSDVFAGPSSAGLVRALWASESAAAPPMSFVVVDSTTGAIVHGFNQELTTYELPSVILNSEDGYETYELPSVSLAIPKMVIGVPISVPVQAFWFTDNGQAETVDTELVIRNGLRDADGVKVKSVDSTDYQGANVLAYMEADGDMFTSSDASFTWFGSDSLRQLFVDNQDARGKSAWSVFAAKLFHLSFVNTQLPDVTIELPAAVVDTYGTSITLPTIDGEYESGGKTWKPSAWDIGAFGSSYSLTADTVAHLVFTEVQQYQEITLYTASGTKAMQTNITSAFKGDVSSSYVYQLYEDESLTTPWTGYDYSNDYEMGSYSSLSGDWVTYPRQSVADMPDTPASTTSEAKTGRMLLDVGRLWVFTNYTGLYAVNISSVKVRIYPKGQQHYAAYVYGSGTYKNVQLTKNLSKICASKPGSTQYIQTPHQFPVITLRKILGAAGNELTLSEFSTYVGQDDSRFSIINKTNAPAVRTVVYTLEYPTFYHWLKSDGTNISTSSGVSYPVMNLGGEIIEIDNVCDYFPIGLLQYNGNWASSTYSYLNNAKMGAFDPDHPTWLCFKQVSGTLSMSCVWYYKKPKPTGE